MGAPTIPPPTISATAISATRSRTSVFELAGMITALTRVPPGDQVAAVVAGTLSHWARVLEVRLYLKPFGAQVAILDGYHGLEAALGRNLRAVPLGGPGAVADAMAFGQPVTVSLGEVEHLAPSFAALMVAAAHDSGDRVVLDYVPMTVATEAVGVIVVTRVAANTSMESPDRAHLLATAGVVSLWAALRRRDPSVSPSPHAEVSLSPRQERILTLVQRGYTNDRVGRELGFSTSTVKADLLRMYDLTGTHNRQHLLTAAAQLGWLADPE